MNSQHPPTGLHATAEHATEVVPTGSRLGAASGQEAEGRLRFRGADRGRGEQRFKGFIWYHKGTLYGFIKAQLLKTVKVGLSPWPSRPQFSLV